ncbi:MAG TPA: cation:proton antiporter [Candidatus Altiarchaeales archaeon]|nr:cation:proton antiporter [Candidatus Altiarchaeales archaeon]
MENIFFIIIPTILILAKIIGELFDRFEMPSILGEILIGIVLGPEVLKILNPEGEFLSFFAQIGAIFLLFSIGFEKIDIEKLKDSIKKATPIASLGVLFPFIFGFIAVYVFANSLNLQEDRIFVAALIVATGLSTTSIGVTIRTLLDLRYFRTIAGLTILFAAILGDIVALTLLALITSFAMTGTVSIMGAVTIFLYFLIFTVIVYIAGKYLLPNTANLIDRLNTEESNFAIMISTAFLFASLAEFFHLHMIMGAFLVGIIFSEIPVFRTEDMSHKVNAISHGLFIPFFFVYVGTLFSFETVRNVQEFAIILITLSVVGKTLGGFLGSWWMKIDKKDSWVIGIGLIPRNEVILVVAAIGIEQKIITEPIFASLVLVAIATTIITPLLLRFVIGRQE